MLFTPSPAFMSKASFNPTSLVGTQGAFWRADVGVSQSSGNVTAWADQGSHGNNLNVIPSTSPQWSSSSFNSSFAGISFNTGGSTPGDSINIASNIVNTTTMSVFILMKYLSAGSDRIVSDTVTSVGNDNSTPSWLFYIPTTQFQFYSSGGMSSPDILTNNTLYVIGAILNGSTVQDYVNFSTGASRSFSSTVGAATAGTFAVGASGSGNSCGMVVAYVLVTNNVLSGTDLTNLKSWTNSNWGTSF